MILKYMQPFISAFKSFLKSYVYRPEKYIWGLRTTSWLHLKLSSQERSCGTRDLGSAEGGCEQQKWLASAAVALEAAPSPLLNILYKMRAEKQELCRA